MSRLTLWNIGTPVGTDENAMQAFQIISVSSTGAGQKPVVTFRVLNPAELQHQDQPVLDQPDHRGGRR